MGYSPWGHRESDMTEATPHAHEGRRKRIVFVVVHICQTLALFIHREQRRQKGQTEVGEKRRERTGKDSRTRQRSQTPEKSRGRDGRTSSRKYLECAVQKQRTEKCRGRCT